MLGIAKQSTSDVLLRECSVLFGTSQTVFGTIIYSNPDSAFNPDMPFYIYVITKTKQETITSKPTQLVLWLQCENEWRDNINHNTSLIRILIWIRIWIKDGTVRYFKPNTLRSTGQYRSSTVMVHPRLFSYKSRQALGGHGKCLWFQGLVHPTLVHSIKSKILLAQKNQIWLNISCGRVYRETS